MEFDLFGALESILDAPTVRTHVGMEVGAGRWPFYGSHPDNWLPPRKGILLAEDDPRAWCGSLLGDDPAVDQIQAHLAWLRSAPGRTPQALGFPVLWEFNPDRAFWEAGDKVIPYREDLAKWEQTRAAMQDGGAV